MIKLPVSPWGGRNALPVFRFTAQSHYCRRRDEPKFDLGYHQRLAPTEGAAVTTGFGDPALLPRVDFDAAFWKDKAAVGISSLSIMRVRYILRPGKACPPPLWFFFFGPSLVNQGVPFGFLSVFARRHVFC